VKFVKVRHPKAGEAVVPESSLPHHARAGWRPVKEFSGRKPVEETAEPDKKASD